MSFLVTTTAAIIGKLPGELTTDLVTSLADDGNPNGSTDSLLDIVTNAGFDGLNGTSYGNDSTSSLDNSGTSAPKPRPPPARDIGLEIQIPIYGIIFLLSVVGNILVIITVIQNKKMRSVTNVFLLNLALSDLLLSVFCMPFTLIPLFLKNFIFGKFMCVAIRYLQGQCLKI